MHILRWASLVCAFAMISACASVNDRATPEKNQEWTHDTPQSIPAPQSLSPERIAAVETHPSNQSTEVKRPMPMLVPSPNIGDRTALDRQQSSVSTGTTKSKQQKRHVVHQQVRRQQTSNSAKSSRRSTRNKTGLAANSKQLILRGPSSSRKVALTFDDGPDTYYTPLVLDTLRKHRVKATFFLVGRLAKAHPDLVRRIIREGHAIGNHTYRHAYLPKLSMERFKSELTLNQNTLSGIAGYSPRIVRPPYGAIGTEQLQWAAAERYTVVNWDVDTEDWRGLNASQIMSNVRKQVRPGSIILQHSGTGPRGDLSGTVKALPAIISYLREQGYELVTVPELLHVTKGK